MKPFKISRIPRRFFVACEPGYWRPVWGYRVRYSEFPNIYFFVTKISRHSWRVSERSTGHGISSNTGKTRTDAVWLGLFELRRQGKRELNQRIVDVAKDIGKLIPWK